MTPVPVPRVRFLGGVDLLGWDEVRAACFAVAGIVGSWVGWQISVVLRALL